MAAFIAAGGIYVHCHLRGGSEFGLDWAKGGRWHNKENGYKDLYAIAEDLINNHRTTAKQLALNGRSFGGLMSSVALTQRPDLWAVVVPQVPIIDLVGACRHPYGRWCIELELGNPEDPETIKRVAAFSPYYQVRKGEKYPAVFIDAGETDPRCPPWHAQKLAARLQRANAADTPILLRVWENSGHGYVNARSMQIAQYTAWLAFVMCQLGMEP